MIKNDVMVKVTNIKKDPEQKLSKSVKCAWRVSFLRRKLEKW